jgi:hypothetical protein
MTLRKRTLKAHLRAAPHISHAPAAYALLTTAVAHVLHTQLDSVSAPNSTKACRRLRLVQADMTQLHAVCSRQLECSNTCAINSQPEMQFDHSAGPASTASEAHNIQPQAAAKD